MKLTSLGLGALLLVGLSACGQKPAPATSNDAAATAGDAAAATTRLGQKVREATEKAREKMATSNISVSEGASTLPKAEITPQGDLLIGGKQVTINEQQRALLLQHRANVTAVALAGMEIGVQGADLGMRAAGEAIKGIFNGNTGEIEKKIEAEAEKMKLSAAKLCEKLPALQESQQALAAAIPEFKPYANMKQADVDGCLEDTSPVASYDAGKDVGAAIARVVKPASEQASEEDAAARADAAAAKP